MKASITITFCMDEDAGSALSALLAGIFHSTPEPGAELKIAYGLRDPRLDELISALDEAEIPFTSREHRSFDAREIAEARALRIKLPVVGRESPGATEYDLSKACALCLAGREQLGELILEEEPEPPPGIALTTSGKLLVHERLARKMIAEHIDDCVLRGVKTSEGGPSSLFQILGFHTLPRMHAPPTRFAQDPERRCPLCQRGGLSVPSMIYYAVPEREFSDLNLSEERLGCGAGRRPELVVSQRFFRIISETRGSFVTGEPVVLV